MARPLEDGKRLPDGTIRVARSGHKIKKTVTPLKRQRMDTLISYLGNPENEWPKIKQEYLKVLGLNASRREYLYAFFKHDEIVEIENKALELRRSRMAPRLSMVDDSLINNAIDNGKAPECKLVYERFEGWRPGIEHEITGAHGGPIVMMPIDIKTMAEWQTFVDNIVDVKAEDESIVSSPTGASDNGRSLPG